jgi:hypothetical protein
MCGSDSGSGEITEFVGGMNVPSRLGGRLNATIPMVRLTIGDGMLRMQPRSFGAVMFTGFDVSLHEIASAFSLRGSFMTAGVGLELSDGQLAYFWSLRGSSRILAVLRGEGIPIDPEPRRARGAISGQLGFMLNLGQGASPSQVAETPGLSPLMLRLMPMFIVLGIVVCVVLALTGGAFGWLAAIIPAIGVMQATNAWRRNR